MLQTNHILTRAYRRFGLKTHEIISRRGSQFHFIVPNLGGRFNKPTQSGTRRTGASQARECARAERNGWDCRHSESRVHAGHMGVRACVHHKPHRAQCRQRNDVWWCFMAVWDGMLLGTCALKGLSELWNVCVCVRL